MLPRNRAPLLLVLKTILKSQLCNGSSTEQAWTLPVIFKPLLFQVKQRLEENWFKRREVMGVLFFAHSVTGKTRGFIWQDQKKIQSFAHSAAEEPHAVILGILG